MWNEVNVLASLSHPNVVKYYDCFADSDDRLVIVMEYCDVSVHDCRLLSVLAHLWSSFR